MAWTTAGNLLGHKTLHTGLGRPLTSIFRIRNSVFNPVFLRILEVVYLDLVLFNFSYLPAFFHCIL